MMKHNGLYSYENVPVECNRLNKIPITCAKHGEFHQTIKSHLVGRGCPQCKNAATSSRCKFTLEDFTSRANRMHSFKFDYSKVIYSGSHGMVIINCPTHGDFAQKAYSHLSGIGCSACGNDASSIKRRNSLMEFIIKSRKIHGDYYSYTKAQYVTSKTKICITCPTHGDFQQIPNGHLCGKGCPKCKLSNGEKAIVSILNECNIPHRTQVKINDCRNLHPLPFDIGVLNYTGDIIGLIEYQGEQHYHPVNWFGALTAAEAEKNFNDLLVRDAIKYDYCQQYNIPLLLISYRDEIKDSILKFTYAIFTHK